MKTILALVLFSVTSPALAKCAMQLHVITGAVADEHGSPVAQAMVGASWTKGDTPQGPAMALTDHNGNYSIPVWIDTWSGMSALGDECHADLAQVSLTAYTDTEYSLPELLRFDQRSSWAAPTLKLEYKIQREPLW